MKKEETQIKHKKVHELYAHMQLNAKKIRNLSDQIKEIKKTKLTSIIDIANMTGYTRQNVYEIVKKLNKQYGATRL